MLEITLEELYTIYSKNPLVCTDTRKILPGCLFFALKGDNFDGNTFAEKALESGAAYAVVDDFSVVKDSRFLLVENVLTTLQELAKHHRSTWDIPVVALTGSNGKTTTKELIAAVLAKKYRINATVGNLNNHIGVPLTLLSIQPDDNTIAVIEMGANHQQEIAFLCGIAQPTHGLITNIGKAHLEGFGGIAGVKKGKGELYTYLSKKKRVLFVNAQDDTLMEMASKKHAFGEIIFYRSASSEVNPTLIEETPFVIYENQEKQAIVTHLPGRHNFDNICAALAIGHYFEVPGEDAHRAISDYRPDNNRSQVIEKGSNTITLDAYNANPSSMRAAIDHFTRSEAPRKMVILGDMLELGDEAAAEHLAIGQLVAEGKFDVVILTGPLMQHALPALPKAYYIPDKFSLHNWIMDHPQENTHILIKGSRGMGLESTLQFL
ncbi:UDP-N-acetylmuramoyl-tripeptide--D-alanyl-D-alanine ligase [Persicitalea jodogahamensis]|uniref:UDP-N-acetylmuramoyl-tripeptide--D-alanyl-D-alanine ligase n=1 Tax=Persicitalea jodogahamensis TaxID=402147 RepID=A0A8J3D8T7_9BACT|nr:UDP-N-acetylmuramoyl-tripeptide--D-alanyl-D-alanine ligase [Persicitalea jodogahamensis]GHB69681.1 UDP-N-acetylmuramoyl-tripeptide--D-alanyl-D-alanine ligase [Persicitalea jodogahamensis]